MTASILLVLGPSGVGKSSMIDEVLRLHPRCISVAAYTTRPPRRNDRFRMSVTAADFRRVECTETLLARNELFGSLYGTPKSPIIAALAENTSVVIDCPVQSVGDYHRHFPSRVCAIYVEPPSARCLALRLDDGRDPSNGRFHAAMAELEQLSLGAYSGVVYGRVVNHDGQIIETAKTIYRLWLDWAPPKAAPPRPTSAAR